MYIFSHYQNHIHTAFKNTWVEINFLFPTLKSVLKGRPMNNTFGKGSGNEWQLKLTRKQVLQVPIASFQVQSAAVMEKDITLFHTKKRESETCY